MKRRPPQTHKRTREDKAKSLCMRLIMASPERIAELMGDHTTETFAKAHGVTPAMIRPIFEEARRRQQS